MRKYIFIILIFIFSLPAEAQLFKPFASFRVIKTNYFDIIFPAESESSARLLVSFADNAYEQMSTLYGISVPGRIPVTFAPHTDMFNGYYNPVPYPHIVLYDTPMDVEWTTFSNNLEALFIHELAHAVSLNTRNRYFRFFQRIFGYWATPAAYNAPSFMIEGVTIAMESLSGFGRANDPLVKQKIRQAIYEDKFLTPFQASGVYDLPGQRGVFYDYGGLFSIWLIETYGMEKYTELWRAIGGNTNFSFFAYRSGFYRIFKNIYNIDFLNVWSNFETSLKLDGIEDNPNEIFPSRYNFFSEKRNSISAITAGQSDIYVLDNTDNSVFVYNTENESIRKIKIDLLSLNDIDVNNDNNLILVSGYNLTGDRYKAKVIEYDVKSGRKTGRTFIGLYKARYFRDGVIGIRSQMHNNCIVYEDFSGNSEILFNGNESLMFSGPQVLDENRITFIVSRNGIRELMLFNYSSKELFRIQSTTGDDKYWSYMRGLGVSEGKLLFSYNSDDRMYKLGFIDLNSMSASFSNRDFSGGVFYPVSADNTVYYSGTFFSGSGFKRFPESLNSLSGTALNINLVRMNTDIYGFNSGINAAIAGSSEEIPLVSKPFFGISYLNPFKFWLPVPLLRVMEIDDRIKINLDGGGILSLLMDPTDRNTFLLMAYADIPYRMAFIDNFTWQSTAPGFPITFEFSDKVTLNDNTDPRRETRMTLVSGFSSYPGRWNYGINLGAGYIRIADYNEELYTVTTSAYEWAETANGFVALSTLSLTNLYRRQNEIFGKGMSLRLKGTTRLDPLFSNTEYISFIETFKPRFEGTYRVSMDSRFPLNMILYGAYDKTGMNIHGISRIYGDPMFLNNASTEYALKKNQTLTWISGGELSKGLFSFEIQNNFSHAYFNRLFCTLTLRNVFYDSSGFAGIADGMIINDFRLAQSLVLNLKLVSSFIPLKYVPIFIEPFLWGAWKFSNTEGSPFAYGFSFNLNY